MKWPEEGNFTERFEGPSGKETWLDRLVQGPCVEHYLRSESSQSVEVQRRG